MMRCSSPGCPGLIDDGYCQHCGDPAPTAPTPHSGSASSSSRSSSATSSAPTTGGPRSRDHLTLLPPLASPPPQDAVLDDPLVPERKRFCPEPTCRAEAGRTGSGREPGNFCPQCGTPVSFRAPLRRGEVVGGHFHVEGAIGCGGLGWVYLARDAELKIWVVLKGLMDPDDPNGQRAATAELEALAAAHHRNIVRVYGKVVHPYHRRRRDGSVLTVDIDYIVMDYVAGRSLKELFETGGLMPVPQVLRYLVQCLDALQHLHERGLLYCDFSPDQAIHTAEGGLQVIDLGGVRRMGSEDVQVWGKRGYQDPAITRTGPSIVTDLYPVGRTAARLSMPFPGFSADPPAPLPSPSSEPTLAAHDSFHRLLRRFLHEDQARRFPSAAEAAAQAEGVLREETAREEGCPCPAPSTVFGPELRVVGADPGAFPSGGLAADALALALPDLQIDASDPHAGLIAALATMSPADLRRELEVLPDPSPESRLRGALAGVRLGGASRAAAMTELETLSTKLPLDPRPLYALGIAALAADDPQSAAGHFSDVLDVWPGELAPKLALGVCAERLYQPAAAADHYETVWRTDHSFVNAAFGLARSRIAVGDRCGAASVLESVPQTSRYASDARLCAILGLARGHREKDPPADGFFAAAEQLSAGRAELADVDGGQRQRVIAEILKRTLGWVEGGGRWPNDRTEQVPTTLLGHRLTVRSLRDGLEHTHRALAALYPLERITHIDAANARRNRSWL